jgi:hypothetical protein
MMDIQRYAVMNVAKDYNSATDISYNRQSGMRASAYEHLIPEKLFTDQTQPNAPQAISAVKALAIAASQGQKIYTITQANQDIILPQINVDPDVMTETQNALSAGNEVTVHQSPITQSGWTGTGYIITDPVTGAGAYKISGGANGAVLFTEGLVTGSIISLTLFALVDVTLTDPFAIPAAAILLLFVATLLIPVAALVSEQLKNASDDERKCYWGGVVTGIGLTGMPGGKAFEWLTRIITFVFSVKINNSTAIDCLSL